METAMIILVCVNCLIMYGNMHYYISPKSCTEFEFFTNYYIQTPQCYTRSVCASILAYLVSFMMNLLSLSKFMTHMLDPENLSNSHISPQSGIRFKSIRSFSTYSLNIVVVDLKFLEEKIQGD